MDINCPNEVGLIRRMLLKHPRDAFISDGRIRVQWKGLNYGAPPVLEKAVQEYEKFVALFEGLGGELEFLPPGSGTGLDSLYVRDAAVPVAGGIIMGSMGKRAREAEPSEMESFLREKGYPVFGRITKPGCLEGGDVVRLNSRSIAVGMGYRTNREGIEQFKAYLPGSVEEVIVVPLPHGHGPGDVLHLMSFLSPVDTGTVLVYSRIMPVFFRERLIEMGFKLLEVPEEEFDSMACNVLALSPGTCVMLAGNPRTRRLLERENITVYEYDGDEISIKGSGGPTCLTLPLVRSPL